MSFVSSILSLVAFQLGVSGTGPHGYAYVLMITVQVSSHTYYKICSAGHRKFFFATANPQPNFNFLNPQPQVRNWTFKSLVRNRKSAIGRLKA